MYLLEREEMLAESEWKMCQKCEKESRHFTVYTERETTFFTLASLQKKNSSTRRTLQRNIIATIPRSIDSIFPESF